MNNWIDEEAEKYRAEKKLEERKEDLIEKSEYWSDVRLQVEKDVEQINNHPVWKEALIGLPLKIERINKGYQIRRERFPSVYVSVINEYDEIEITTTIKKSTDSRSETKKERLKLNSDGESVYLESQSGILHIPEETSKYILTPIIKALNKTL